VACQWVAELLTFQLRSLAYTLASLGLRQEVFSNCSEAEGALGLASSILYHITNPLTN
jgi:hypothetical protein